MTNTHSTSSHSPEQMAEPDHVDIGSILRYAIGLAAITGISMLAMYFTYQGMANTTDASHAVRAYPMAELEDNRRPPEPRLQGSNATYSGNLFDEANDRQVTPREALKALHAEEDAVLNNYAWVDRNAGVVRLPIADAMKLRLQQGLEARPAAGSAPAAAPAAEEPAKEQGK